jgi:hypothetical protein
LTVASVPASDITGTLPLAQLPAAVVTTNAIATNTPSQNNAAYYFVGDSQTFGTGSAQSYPFDVGLLVGSTNIFNQGIPGAGSYLIFTNYAASVAANNAITNWPTLFMAGRNDAPFLTNYVGSNITAMVSLHAPANYWVLSVLNATNEGYGSANQIAITNLNAFLAAAFAGHYIDVRTALLQSGLTNTPLDYWALTNGVPPPSQMSDEEHPNQFGYNTIAKAVFDFAFGNKAQIVSQAKLSESLLGMNPGNIGQGNMNIGNYQFGGGSGVVDVYNLYSQGPEYLYSGSSIVGGVKADAVTATNLFNISTALSQYNGYEIGGVVVLWSDFFNDSEFTGNSGNRGIETGQYNTGDGQGALGGLTTGNNNTAVGEQALHAINIGNYNTGIGPNAGGWLNDGVTPNTNSSFSIFIGASTTAAGQNDNAENVIGVSVAGNGPNTTTIGQTYGTST